MSIVTKESNPELYNALFPEDEIKEILDRLNENKDYDDYVDYKGSYFKPLLDYITNLQEEVKSSNESIIWWQNRFNALQKENERLREKLEDETLNKEIAQGHRKQVQDIELQERKEIERLNNVINELEKEINNQLNMTRKFDKYNEGYFNATLNYYNKLKALKEGKE